MKTDGVSLLVIRFQWQCVPIDLRLLLFKLCWLTLRCVVCALKTMPHASVWSSQFLHATIVFMHFARNTCIGLSISKIQWGALLGAVLPQAGDCTKPPTHNAASGNARCVKTPSLQAQPSKSVCVLMSLELLHHSSASKAQSPTPHLLSLSTPFQMKNITIHTAGRFDSDIDHRGLQQPYRFCFCYIRA